MQKKAQLKETKEKKREKQISKIFLGEKRIIEPNRPTL